LASAASCGDARSDWPTMEADGVLPSSRTMSHRMWETSCRLPASITPTVSVKATRARSTATAGASSSLNPTT
jgi:hypothetical protein